MGYIANGMMPVKGDKDKAMNAVYEVVVGKGAGAGRGSERFLPLGTDMMEHVTQGSGRSVACSGGLQTCDGLRADR